MVPVTLPPAFFLPGEHADTFVATALTRGPWHNGLQHGGPPTALLARALSRAGDHADDFALVRMTVDLLRPVPIGPVHLAVQPIRLGREVQRWSAVLTVGDRVCIEAVGLRMRQVPVDMPAPPTIAPWPDPETLSRYQLGFFKNPVGYHNAVDMRVAVGAWGTTPIGMWARPLVPLIAGLRRTPLESLVILADAQSGMGIPTDPLRTTFVNPDLTIILERAPREGWLGFDIRSAGGPLGSGLSQSALRDQHGAVGRSAQTLLLRPRLPD